MTSNDINWHKMSEEKPSVGDVCLLCTAFNSDGSEFTTHSIARWLGTTWAEVDDISDRFSPDGAEYSVVQWAKIGRY